MKPITMGLVVLTILPVAACHQPRRMAPQIPLEGIDGRYTFTISTAAVKLEGRFIVVHSEAHMLEPRRCVPIEGPEASPEMRAAWFECWGSSRPSEASLRLRISEVDPITQSRWYARMRVADTVYRCQRYTSTGDCTSLLRARGMKWVDRNGSITVVRGFPAEPDTSRALPFPRGTSPLRVRCDTSAVNARCSEKEEAM